MSTYAKGTKVAVAKTRVEIESLLTKHGATRTGVATEPGQALVYFELQGLRVQFTLALPTEDAVLLRRLTAAQRKARLEQLHRESWRALLLSIKAKFVSIDNGVESFEQSFLAHIVVPGGSVGSHVLPAVAEAYRSGRFLLPSGATP